MSGDDQRISDYLDGRLDPPRRAEFEARLALDQALARRLRLLRALKSALAGSASAMPADLKADLKRRARERSTCRSWPDLLRDSFGIGPWTYGVGAALAAACLAVVARFADAPRPVPAPVALIEPRPSVYALPAGAAPLADLWSDDDGGDDDEG